MKVKVIEERIKSLENGDEKKNSSFYLVSYSDNASISEPCEVLPIENNTSNLEFDGRTSVLSDNEGNVLKIFEQSNCNILYANKDDIVIEEKKDIFKKTGVLTTSKRIEHYSYSHYDKKLKVANKLFDDKNEQLFGVSVPSNKKGIILLRKRNSKERIAALYSVSEKDYITPMFYDLEVVDGHDDLFKFTDIVFSSETIRDNPIQNKIIGYIDTNKRFSDEIFDERLNDLRPVNFNEHPLFLQYRAFKHCLSMELDSVVDEEIEKIHTKNNRLKHLEYKTIKKQEN